MRKLGRTLIFCLLISLTLLISTLSVSPVQASRESAVPGFMYEWYLPVGTTQTKTPTFSWRGVSDATYYRLNVYRKSDNQYIVHNLDINAATYCKNTLCKYTPTTFINPMVYGTEYKWKIAAGNSDGLGQFTGLTYFTPRCGINSTFTTDALGWQPKYGYWKVTPEGYYKGSSTVTEQWITSRHKDVFADFAVETRLYKTGTDPYSYGLIIRGDTSSYTADKLWVSGYLFVMADSSEFSIWRMDPGVPATNLVPWTDLDLIDGNAFNIMRISAKGPVMRLFINGVFVGQINDETYTSGRVGLASFFSGASLNADYVKLTMPDPPFMFTTESAGMPANCKMDPRGCFPIK